MPADFASENTTREDKTSEARAAVKTESRQTVAEAQGRPASAAAVAGGSVAAGDYLEQEAALAKQAMSTAIADLKRTLAGAFSPPGHGGDASDPNAPSGVKGLAASHPYYTLAGAAAAGFLAASVFVPSKETQVLRKLAALERAAALHGRDVVSGKPGKGVVGAMVGALAATVKPALLHAITASLAAKTAADAAESPKHEGNGHGGARHEEVERF